MKKKRFQLSCIEEAVLNPKYKGYRGGRIEVFDSKNRKSFHHWEFHFLLPEEIFDSFYNIFDGLKTDMLPEVTMDAIAYHDTRNEELYGKKTGFHGMTEKK
jgi:hypothetical protein